MRSLRTLSATLLSLVVAGVLLVANTGTAQAAEPSEYWIYDQVVDGEFKSSDKGVAATKPADGSVEAFRWGATADFPSHVHARADLEELSFDGICGDTEAEAGKKRVAVLVDFGVEEDAPQGQEPPAPYADCALVSADASGLQVLDAVADVRTEQSSFGPSLCGIDGYPAQGCFGTVDAASPADAEPVDFTVRSAGEATDAAAADEDDSNLPVLLGVGALVVVLLGGGLLLSRRSRNA